MKLLNGSGGMIVVELEYCVFTLGLILINFIAPVQCCSID